MKLYRDFFKLIFDFILSLIGFIFLLPVFLAVALMIIISDKQNPFFLQQRPGKKEKVFTLVKFKTMNNKRDAQGNLLSDKERLTTIGKFIRKTSLDEIPQLINVLKGDMSLVGPRPLLNEYLPLYDQLQKKRHDVKPGITGWAQVNGRNAIAWKDKFNYDVWYVNHLSFLLDIKILFKTFAKVFKSEGVNATDSATMEKFTGN